MVSGGGGSDKVEPTIEEKELARIAEKKYARYEDTFQPAEDEFIDSVMSIDEGDADLAAGTTAAGSQQAFSQAAGKVADSQIEAGAAPGSGRFNSAVTAVGRDAATAKGGAIARSRRATTDRRLSGMEAISAIGQGQEAESLDTISDVAREAQADSIEDARISANNRATNAQAAGTLVGAGASYYDGGGGGLNSMKRRSKGYSAPSDGYRGG